MLRRTSWARCAVSVNGLRCRVSDLPWVRMSLETLNIAKPLPARDEDTVEGRPLLRTVLTRCPPTEAEVGRLLHLAKACEVLQEAWGCTSIIGVDEAGRGCWAGPVAAGAVAVPCEVLIEGVKDSKRLSESARREALAMLLSSPRVRCGVALMGAAEIDQLNILEATRRAMDHAARLALGDDSKETTGVAIDGTSILRNSTASRVAIPGGKKEGMLAGCRAVEVVKGDNTVLPIAAASIVAKVVRDGIMLALSKYYPDYHFATNKAYGTASHVKAIKATGVITGVHRLSYKPLQDPALPRHGGGAPGFTPTANDTFEPLLPALAC